jgi:DNA-binding transcriptional ArsR family regulator
MADMEFIRQPGRAALVLQPMRRLLLTTLAEPDSAAGLSRRLGIPRQRLNYHLKELEKEGLLHCIEERRKGNCTERVLRATARTFVISPEALGTLGEHPEQSADRFSADYLASATAKTLNDVGALRERATREGRKLATLTIETEIRFASTASRAAFAEDLADAVARLAARYHDDAAPAGRRFRMLACVHPALTKQSEEQP